MLTDMQDIVTGPDQSVQPTSIQDIVNPEAARKKKRAAARKEGALNGGGVGGGENSFKRPEGMNRELYNLYVSDKKGTPIPLVPTLTPAKMGGYKNSKARLGLRKCRQWRMVSFLNQARTDNLGLTHWRRTDNEDVEYPFARFNKAIDVPTFTDEEYSKLLVNPAWTRAETDHLMDLARRFDLRWPIVQDRWDRNIHANRSIEDLKERFYDLWNVLIKNRTPSEVEPVAFKFDADHERRRKEQLEKLWNRTDEQVEEEEKLMMELRKIEARQKERERKAQDLQKLITAADRAPLQSSQPTPPGSMKKKQAGGTGGAGSTGRHHSVSQPSSAGGESSTTGLKFAEYKVPGPHMRSQKMKLPQQIGQKKLKAVQTAINTLGLEHNPMGTEDICREFNELRQDVVLLFELKSALASCEFDLEAKRQQYLSSTGQDLEIPSHVRVSQGLDGAGGGGLPTAHSLPLTPSSTMHQPPSPASPSPSGAGSNTPGAAAAGPSTPDNRRVTNAMDLGSSQVPTRRRKAAIEQSGILRRLRKS